MEQELEKKIKYLNPDLNIITLNSHDILADSNPSDNDDPVDDPYEE